MTTRDALLAAIVDAPDDDLPRLVYADWLDESGGAADVARAELIRTQVAAARLPTAGEERQALDRRAELLWEAHKLEWFEGIPADNLPYPVRGFITSWFCQDVVEFSPDSPAPFGREPISELTLSLRQPGELARAGAWPGLSRVRELRVWPGTTSDAELVPFFSSPHLTGVRTLWVMGNRRGPWGAMPDALRFLATDPRYATLTDLSIEYADVGDAGATALAGSQTLRGLKRLGIGQCRMGMAGVRAVLASPVLGQVTHLGLGGQGRTAADGEALARSLAASEHLARLVSLGLDETAFTDRAASELRRAGWPSFKRLMIVPHAVNHSDEPTGLPTMTARGLESLLSAEWATTLEDLELSGHPFGDPGAEAIARGGRLSHLRRLTLIQTGLTAAGLREIVRAYSPQLTLLQLARNPFGDNGATAVAEATWPAMLPTPAGTDFQQRGLYLSMCGITDRGAEALAQSAGIPDAIPELFLGASDVSLELVVRLKAKYPSARIRF